MALPGPDYPGRPRRPAPKKPKPPRTTPGNVYSSPPPPKPNPRIVRRYPTRPAKIAPGLILKKRGGGLGYVTVRKPPKMGGAPGGPTVNPISQNPYAGLPGWAQQELRQVDADQAAHQDYAGKVADWLKGALTGLTGVDPARPGINQTLQQQYLGNVQGVVGGALNAAAAGAMGPAITPTTPGGIAASPTSYLSGAAAQGDFGRAAAALQGAQIQSSLNTLQPNLASQGYEYAYAAIRQGLPEVYARKRAERRSAIDQFIAKSAADAETIRHHKVQEATSAYNAQAAAAAAYGRLGISASGQAFDQAQDTTAAATPAPPGYVRDPATGEVYRDPNVPQATSGGSGGGGGGGGGKKYSVNQLRKEGFTRLPAKAGPKWKDRAVRATDGSLWIKQGSASSSPKPPKVTPYGDLVTDLGKKWNGSGSGPFSSGSSGWAETFRGNRAGLANALAGWVIANKASFTKRDGTFDPDKVMSVISTLGDSHNKWLLIAPILKRRIGADGRLR